MAEEIGGVDVSDFGLSAEDLANLKRNQALYSAFGLGSKEDRASQLEEQKSMTKANILFDLAQAGLIIAATPPTKGESPAATLARAAASSEFFPKVGARSAELQKTKTAMDAQERQMNMAAVQRMQTQRDTRIASEAAAAARRSEQDFEIKKMNLGYAQDLAKLGEESRLNRNTQIIIENLKQNGRIDLEKEKLIGEKSLVNLRNSGAITLEDYKFANRQILEGQMQENREAIEQLRQSGQTADLILADKLEKENISLRHDNALTKLGVANTFELGKMEKANEYAVEINKTNNALKEKLASLNNEVAKRNAAVNENRLALDENQAKINNAVGERKIELEEERLALEEVKVRLLEEKQTADEFYNSEKIRLEEAASHLTKFGTSTEARITTFLADKNRIDQYGSGLSKEEGGMSEQEIIEMNQVISYYARPKTVWNEEKKQFITVQGNPLSKELLEALEIRKLSDQIVPNIPLTDAEKEIISKNEKIIKVFESKIMADVGNPLEAFGSDVVIKGLINDVWEAITLGKKGAPYKETKDAVTAVKTLNTNFVQVYQKAAELRDSVFQLKKIESILPTASALFTGDDKALSQTKATLALIEEGVDKLQTYLDKQPLDSKEFATANKLLNEFRYVEAGYKVIFNAGKALISQSDLTDEEREKLVTSLFGD